MLPQFQPQAYLCAYTNKHISKQYTDVIVYDHTHFPKKMAQFIDSVGQGWANQMWQTETGRLYVSLCDV